MAHPTMDVAELEAQLQELQDYVSDTELTLPDEVDVPKVCARAAAHAIRPSRSRQAPAATTLRTSLMLPWWMGCPLSVKTSSGS